jgi:hypothetical protein
MPHDERVIVRRNRQGKITKVMVIHSPASPGPKLRLESAGGTPLPRVVRSEEIASAKLPEVLKEMDKETLFETLSYQGIPVGIARRIGWPTPSEGFSGIIPVSGLSERQITQLAELGFKRPSAPPKKD